MTRHVPIAEFKDKVSELIAAAEAGEEVVITRHGRAAARLLPIGDMSEERSRKALAGFERMRRSRERLRAEGKRVSVDEWIGWKNEGRP